MIQDTVFTVSVLLMLVITATFAFVAMNAAKEQVTYPPLQEKSHRIRIKFFWVLVVAGVVLTVISTLDLPYAATRGDTPSDALAVDIEGQQWFWQINDTDFTAGDTVVFNVTATDVTHGLGVYDADMRLLGQTQAMPGYTNALQLTLEEPGTYKLMCLEYCGLAHHAMTTDITVSEGEQP